MHDGRRILAVVPARGGSKGIPLKNLRKVCGRSLVAWVGDVVAQVECIDRSVVSTDHDEIAAEAENHGIEAPFRRPAELSGDRIGDVAVLRHALTTIESIDGLRYDIVVMLQPTSPTRRPDHITAAVRQMTETGADAVWSVSATNLKAHPLKQLVIENDGTLRYYDPRGAQIIARQQLTPVYHRNGIVYAIKRKALLDDGVLLPERSSAIVIDEPVVNIDTEEDLIRAEQLLINHAHQRPGVAHQ